MLSVEDIYCSYGSIEAVRGVSLEAPDGSVVCILGANGAGKSTTLKAIAGMVRPRKGRVTLDGRDITRLGPSRKLSEGIALAPEGRRILEDFSVRDNLRVGGHLLTRSKLEARMREAVE